MATRNQLQSKLREEVIKQMSMAHQMEALKKLHEAAAMMSSHGLCERYREEMHSLLDMQLDTVMGINVISRQLIDAIE